MKFRRRARVRNSEDSIERLIPEASETDKEIIREALTMSMTSVERLWALLQAVRYLEANGIRGDFVECGVWKGGSSFLMAKALQGLESEERAIWLFDTFEGMVEPTEKDRALDGKAAGMLLDRDRDRREESNIWAIAGESEVRTNMAASGYPMRLVNLVKGDVKDSVRRGSLPTVALARLDTDWYESTKHELTEIMPRMAPGGVVIVDDYGHWSGSKQAVDEWLSEADWKPLVSRIDYTGRMWVMP